MAHKGAWPLCHARCTMDYDMKSKQPLMDGHSSYVMLSGLLHHYSITQFPTFLEDILYTDFAHSCSVPGFNVQLG